MYRLTHRKNVSHKYMFSTWPVRDTSSYAWWVWAGQPLTIEDKCPNVTCENQGCGNDKFKERNNARLVPCIIRNRAKQVKHAHVQWLYFITVLAKVVYRHFSKCDSLDNFSCQLWTAFNGHLELSTYAEQWLVTEFSSLHHFRWK